MDNNFFDKTKSRQAEAGDPGNQGLRGSRDPGVPCLHGGSHTAPVPHPRLAVEQGDRGVRDPGPSHSGHAPYADHNIHHKDKDSLPPPEAVRGLQGPLDNVDGGEDRGHAPNADILASDKLSKTLQKLASSVIWRSPVTTERQTGNDIRRPKPQYCPSWVKMNYSASEVFDIESQPSDQVKHSLQLQLLF